ncbi:MAG: AraC family transcriptional regulator [Gammaproteobacteria bacterium]|nr:AraC family transcriptional regulator [Gammaproteobacteria bacterium]
MDILSDILQSMKLRGTVYFRASFHAPWGMEIPAGQFANFHIVTDGSCWLRNNLDSSLYELRRGDIAIFPHGACHTLACSPDAETVPATTLFEQTQRSAADGIIFGGDGQRTTSLICGHFEYDKKLTHPLFDTLDDLILVTAGSSPQQDFISTAAKLAAQVSNAAAPGVNAIVDRLAEALFIQAMAAYVEQREDGASFLAALSDRQISAALTLLHEDIARTWTLSNLAEAAAMSRSHFAERFRTLVGEPPMVYLARWRMIRARELLAETRRPIVDISCAVGYRSEFAFAKAFKKIVGETPASVRKTLISS